MDHNDSQLFEALAAVAAATHSAIDRLTNRPTEKSAVCLFVRLSVLLHWCLPSLQEHGDRQIDQPTDSERCCLSVCPSVCLSALAAAAKQQIRNFNPQDLANTAWAVAKVNDKDSQLFEALTGAVKQRMRNFDPQDLANTAWALTDSAACTLVS